MRFARSYEEVRARRWRRGHGVAKRIVAVIQHTLTTDENTKATETDQQDGGEAPRQAGDLPRVDETGGTIATD